jgi:hypothetical protein
MMAAQQRINPFGSARNPSSTRETAAEQGTFRVAVAGNARTGIFAEAFAS